MVGAIALRPVGNGPGSFYFLSITTGRVLNWLYATALPMPDDVIDKLHRMTRQQKSNPGLIFTDRNLNPEEYTANEIHPKYALKKYRVQIACTLNKIYSPYRGHI